MPDQILEIEQSLTELLTELESIRSANEQITHAGIIADQAINSAEAVARLGKDVFQQSGSLIDEIKNAHLAENVKVLQDETDRIIGRLHDVLSGLTLLDQRQGIVIEGTRKTQDIALNLADRLHENALKLQEMLALISTIVEESGKTHANRHEQLLERFEVSKMWQDQTDGLIESLIKANKFHRWIFILLSLVTLANLVISIIILISH